MDVDYWGRELKLLRTVWCECVQASFDEYLQDRARVFRAMFPDESRSERLGEVNTPHALPRSVDFLRQSVRRIDWLVGG
jgi:hypothetical protein